MKKTARFQKTVFWIVSVLVLLRIGSIFWGNELDEACFLSREQEEIPLADAEQVACENVSQYFIPAEKRLQGLEFVFTNIPEEPTGSIVVKIMSGDALLYQTNISLSGLSDLQWKGIFVNAEMAPGQEYEIVLTAGEDCAQIPSVPVLLKQYPFESTSACANGERIDGRLAVNYRYYAAPGPLEKCCMALLWVLVWLGLSALIDHFSEIKAAAQRAFFFACSKVDPKVLLPVAELLCAAILIHGSKIEFHLTTKVIIYAVSIVAMINFDQARAYLFAPGGLVDCGWKKVVLVVLYAYAAFALAGQRLLIYPLARKLTVTDIFVCLIAVLWFVPVIHSLLYGLERAGRWITGKARPMRTWQFVLLCGLLQLVPLWFNLIAFNPGITSPDSVACMLTQEIWHSSDWYPAFYRMIIRAILWVWNSTYAVILVQHFFWVYVCLELLLYLRKKGLRDSVLICIAIFMGFNAGNYLQVNTIWKDIPYTLSLFWALILLAKLSIDFDGYRRKWYLYFELVTAMTGIFLYRQNGIVPYLLIAAFALIFLRKNKRVLAAISISAALIFFVKGPVYGYFDIQSVTSGMYIGLSQDILGVYYSGGEVSKETLQMINVMTDYDNDGYSYNATYATQSYDLDVTIPVFIKGYLDTFLKNPVIMTRAVIARQDLLWDIFQGEDALLGCVNYQDTADGFGVWNDWYPPRKYVSLYPIAAAAGNCTANSQWISAIEWRCGLLTLLGLVSFAWMLMKGRIGKKIVLISPILGQMLSLVLSTGWSDFRFFWPCNLLNLALILFAALSACPGVQRQEEKNLTAG